MIQSTRREFIGRVLGAGTALALSQVPGLEALAQEPKKKMIVLDAGHGMDNTGNGRRDPGAIYPIESDNPQFRESEIVLDQADRVGKLLAPYFDVTHTRINETTSTPLGKRAVWANQANADLFVSLHLNSVGYESAHGVRTYHFPNSKKGIVLARSIHDSLRAELEARIPNFEQDYDGVRTERFRVLKKTTMPAVLVESGFLSNLKDRRYLTKNPDVVALGIAKGIYNYFK